MDDASTRPDANDEGSGDADEADAGGRDADGPDTGASGTDTPDDLESLRREVEQKYDFDDFGPSDMARMSAEEWDAVFDPDTWITGEELLDRVEAELKTRIARRDVFGVLERVHEGGEPRVLVYSDEGYVIVYPSGEVTGQGTILRDVEPVVALASMDSYDVSEPPDDWALPDPDTVPQGSGEFGNVVMQIVAAVQIVGGIALLGAFVFFGVDSVIAPAIGLLFLLIGGLLFAMVANARLSDRFRAEEYRNRLRAVRGNEGIPEFVPLEPDERPARDERDDRERGTQDR